MNYALPLTAFVGSFTLMLLVGAPVKACPPGHYQMGGGNAGWVGCAPMDGGVGSGNSAPSIADMNITAPRLSTYDAKQWVDFFEQMAQSSIETERELVGKENPEVYEALLQGVWIFGSSKLDSKVPMCTATFATRRGGVMFQDWTGDEPGTFLAFYNVNIQRVNQVKRVRVRLEQSGESQTVEAFQTNYPLVDTMGMLMFRVPSTEALLSSIEDNQDFNIYMRESDIETRRGLGLLLLPNRGRNDVEYKVVSGEWHSGLSARDALKACIQKRDAR
ncbi:hypothetical protein [Synechococcus elongatus]|nr:hypothetical protein [Synechococcus elongatus]AJD56807.1 hypothetical protein M744_02555 [Synechococcus elongatus UTEX 2973]MBD2587968.1 hypothetical protein [Synechococcus elongatus FACHB-242]MBD2689036.1 hypothetical protein [Synechococcus elongatus FACHB-1061]MBD2707324.1 hypothetical protein [Synechococcus elongatus PCC 7942 = FACHB-805]UOW69886.1 hypothetical protein PCC7943_0107 [Synechococcus elongatus PCC 7943]